MKIDENNKAVQFFSTCKMYLSRSMSYISIVNFGMILLVALGDFKEEGIINFDLNLTLLAPFLFLATILIAVVAGKLEDYFGFYRAEKKVNEKRSYHFIKMTKLLEKIDERLEKLERK